MPVKGPWIDLRKNPYPDDRLKLDVCPICGKTARIVDDPLVPGARVAIHRGRYEGKTFTVANRCLISEAKV